MNARTREILTARQDHKALQGVLLALDHEALWDRYDLATARVQAMRGYLESNPGFGRHAAPDCIRADFEALTERYRTELSAVEAEIEALAV